LIRLHKLADEARLILENVSETAADLTVPSLRLGVTGLARSGKTVFITALIHNLIHGGRLPLFEPVASGRIGRAFLQPQPDDAVPRFDYEAHISALVDERIWPDSTRQISELRLTIEYESASYLNRKLGHGKLHLDIVDYPGEWLLDLPLLSMSFDDFSSQALRLARSPSRAGLASDWLSALDETEIEADEDEATAKRLAAAFTEYLSACRNDANAFSMLPPGRFLMPGDLEGSPALTFTPLDLPKAAGSARTGSLRAMMERRFESYKKHVVRPFFRNHFARLDRQIVLVDALNAINAGPEALTDLEAALGQVLTSFRPGRKTWLASILARRIDRILFAATKADHLHREDHDRLQMILKRLVSRGMDHARFKGAEVDVLALSAVRATREAKVTHDGDTLPAIMGTPLPGEVIDGQSYDGKTEVAVFPGDLPDSADELFAGGSLGLAEDTSDPVLKFLRFRPPKLERTVEGVTLSLPHVRLDRALDFLLGDKLA